jgi:glycosyltransferase involved in cell wall biosynthesis
MKIIHLTTFLDFGGIERKKENLSSLRDENEWIFVAINKGGFAEKKIHENKKKVICLELPYKIPSFITLIKIYKFLKREKPDVLHTSGAEANFFGFFAGKTARIPKIIVEEIGISNQSKIAQKIYQFIFRNADCAIGESKLVVNHFTEKYKLNIDQTKVVPNFGLFNYNFSNINIRKRDVFTISIVSRLEPVKNIGDVIRVVSKLVNQDKLNIKLQIIGSGSIEYQLKNLAIELKAEDFIIFLGFQNNPYPYFVDSDLYILNSFSEGFSNSLLEAMYSKTPSLTTIVGAAEEIIKDGENGFLVFTFDENSLYLKMKQIISLKSQKLIEIGYKGHQTIVDNYSLQNHIDLLLQLYKNKHD